MQWGDIATWCGIGVSIFLNLRTSHQVACKEKESEEKSLIKDFKKNLEDLFFISSLYWTDTANDQRSFEITYCLKKLSKITKNKELFYSNIDQDILALRQIITSNKFQQADRVVYKQNSEFIEKLHSKIYSILDKV